MMTKILRSDEKIKFVMFSAIFTSIRIDDKNKSISEISIRCEKMLKFKLSNIDFPSMGITYLSIIFTSIAFIIKTRPWMIL